MAAAPIPVHRKTPGEELDFGRELSGDLEAGEVLSTVTWTVPPGLTLVGQQQDADTATVTLSGGTVGEEYRVVGNFQTTGGSVPRTYERSMDIVVVADRG